jgi:thiol-disulfide isomerase/thioredoxin
MWNKFLLKVSILLTGFFFTAVHYKTKPSVGDKEIHQESFSISGVDWHNQTAPDFEMRTITGQLFNLEDEVGKKVIVLNFFATWCGACRAEMPELERYFAKHRSNSFLLVAVDAEEQADRVHAFLDEFKVTFPAGVDQGAIQQKYDIEAFPTTVVIGVDGKVQFYGTGAVVNAEVAFDNLLDTNQQLIQAGQTISLEAYRSAAHNQQSLPLLYPAEVNTTER